MGISKRTRLIVRVLFFGGLGCAWYWFFVTTPRREFWYLITFTIALAVVFDVLERKVWSPRDGAGRFVLELAFAVLSLIAWGFVSALSRGS